MECYCAFRALHRRAARLCGLIFWGDEIGLVPHSQPVLPVEKFVAFLSQIPPRGPFLPVAPVYNYHAVNNLPFWELHGMEEVIGIAQTLPGQFAA
ncbi:hypothetical protein ACOBR2_16060 [Telmatobacter bradus]|uniref:hypothetical protein n=1 Tax=Telmatobacter bradus TaxID=474953 RepID=UPI003B42EA34